MNRVFTRMLYLLLFMLIWAPKVYSQDLEDSLLDDLLGNPDFLSQFEQEHQAFQQSNGCTPEMLVEKLVDVLRAPTILQNRIYKASNTPVSRSILDLPIFQFTCAGKDAECLSLFVMPFYNQTSKMFFTDSDPFITSYIGLNEPNLIDEITQILEDLFPNDPLNPQEIIPLFTQIKLQERRTGVYFRVCANNSGWTFQLSVPLMYQERNFFLTNQEREAIEMSPFIRELSAGSDSAQVEQLLTQHLVADKVGISDTRIHLLYTPYEGECNRFTGGLFVTLPTAVSFIDGLVGSSFCKQTPIPPFSFDIALFKLCNLNPPRSEEILNNAQLTAFAFGVLDRLTGIVAEQSLGNNGHVTIAPLAEWNYKFSDCLSLNTQTWIQYVTPTTEARAFISPSNPAEFDRDYDDPAKAEENLAFLHEQLILSLFPIIENVRVKPGPIFDINTQFQFSRDHCITRYEHIDAGFGYDFWWRGAESFTFLQEPCFPVDCCAALNVAAWQHKFFGNIDITIPQRDTLITIGLRADVTFASQGIGKDFTLALNLAFIF